jgi:hypothetical protein
MNSVNAASDPLVSQVPIVEEDKSTSLMYQLQALFGFLQESERQYYETRDLCHAYRCARTSFQKSTQNVSFLISR